MSHTEDILISVIIPTYNREQTIKRAIDSVINQTYTNWELIIIDDGSTDSTANLIKPYLDDRRIKCVEIDNGGAPHARNFGIEQSRGDYIAFLDSDDEYEADRLEIQLNKMLDNDTKFSISSRKIEKNHVLMEDDNVECFLSQQDFVKGQIGLSTSLFMFHKSIKGKIQFDEQLQSMQDFDFLLRILKMCPILLLAEPLTIIHKSADIPRISTNYANVATGRKQILTRVCNEIYPLSREQAEQLSLNLSFAVGFYSFLCGNMSAARNSLREFVSIPMASLSKKILAVWLYLISMLPFSSKIISKLTKSLWKNDNIYFKKLTQAFGR